LSIFFERCSKIPLQPEKIRVVCYERGVSEQRHFFAKILKIKRRTFWGVRQTLLSLGLLKRHGSLSSDGFLSIDGSLEGLGFLKHLGSLEYIGFLKVSGSFCDFGFLQSHDSLQGYGMLDALDSLAR
jgi:hypothetical protein